MVLDSKWFSVSSVSVKKCNLIWWFLAQNIGIRNFAEIAICLIQICLHFYDSDGKEPSETCSLPHSDTYATLVFSPSRWPIPCLPHIFPAMPQNLEQISLNYERTPTETELQSWIKLPGNSRHKHYSTL
jgi:hypothetical protein